MRELFPDAEIRIERFLGCRSRTSHCGIDHVIMRMKQPSNRCLPWIPTKPSGTLGKKLITRIADEGPPGEHAGSTPYAFSTASRTRSARAGSVTRRGTRWSAQSEAGIEVAVYPAVVHRKLPPAVSVSPTLARGRLRIPYRAIGHRRAFALHDALVSRALKSLASQVDVVHLWPLGARRTLVTARQLGIPTVLERRTPILVSRTRWSERVRSARGGTSQRPRARIQCRCLRIEEEEYALADYLLCPSDFVVQSFLDEGFGREKLLRHLYGYDPSRFFPAPDQSPGPSGCCSSV